MNNLFSKFDRGASPLPARIRPESWDEYVGQDDLRTQLQGQTPHSMILYGPPGCGKTTLARILAKESGREFSMLSAVSSGVKEVRQVIEQGRSQFYNQGQGALLFLDEIHRFSKSQQDALLEAVELGWVLLIGATTENPAFGVIGPLLSRCRIYHLKALEKSALVRILDRAIKNGFGADGLRFSDPAVELLLEASLGDARRLLGFVEHARNLQTDSEAIDEDRARVIIEGQLRNYDRAGENHYDFISAFIKSLRGSDPDAALLYLAAMLESGEEPLYLARRMLIFASEDIGNASPQAMGIALSAYQALERLGMPEGRIILGQLVTFLASSPKSNSAYKAIDLAMATVKNRTLEIPLHLRNAPTAVHKTEGAGRDYQYPHEAPAGFVRENYFPAGFENSCFYKPGNSGQEERIAQRLTELWPERYSNQ